MASTQDMASAVVLTEISLNESNSEQSNSDQDAINVNLIPVSQTVMVAPSLLSLIANNNNSNNNNGGALITPADYAIPPASELPSYNEALRLKKQEANEVPPSYYPTANATDSRIVIEEAELRGVSDSLIYDQDIGSECMFLSAFMIAFFFNWIGFFASICLLPNAAGKYGALSGFGLSMAKWVTIVRYQEWMNNMNDFQQKLFFWLFIFLGFYLFFRGLINYMSLKYRPRQATIDYTRERNRNRWFGFIE